MQKHRGLLYKLLLTLSLVACIRPQFFNFVPNIDIFYLEVLIIASFISGYIFFSNIKEFKFTRSVSLFFAVLLLPTILYNLNLTNIIFFVKTYLSIWTIVVLTEYAFVSKREMTFLKTVNTLILSLLVPNLIFILFFGANYLSNRSAFLGYDNTVLPFILFGAATPYLAVEKTKHKSLTILTYLNVILVIINCLIVESSNAKIAAVMLLAMMALKLLGVFKKKTFNKYFNLKTYTILSIIMFTAIVIFRLQYLFEDIIVNDLHRNLTITGRTDIWDLAIEYIKRNPLIGLGVEEWHNRGQEIGIFHAHSTYLNILFESGLLGILAYLNIYRTLWKKTKNKKHENIAQFSFMVLIFFTITVIEYYEKSHTYYMLLTVMYYLPNMKIAKNITAKGDK